jgi:hypothetical protein
MARIKARYEWPYARRVYLSPGDTESRNRELLSCDYVQRVEDMASDAMVSKSFYLMREYRVRLEYRKVFQTYDGTLHDLKWYREVTTKRRGSANSPFHFSTATSLTTSQLAILAALGLTAT